MAILALLEVVATVEAMPIAAPASDPVFATTAIALVVACIKSTRTTMRDTGDHSRTGNPILDKTAKEQAARQAKAALEIRIGKTQEAK